MRDAWGDLLRDAFVEPVLLAFDEPQHQCKHFYVAIDDGKYVEKCVLCDEPKG